MAGFHQLLPLLSFQRKKRQKWPFSRSSTQNKPGLKKFHDLTLFHGARHHGAVVILHGALPLGAVVFSSVAAPRRAISRVG
jgi:hypothetical protein